MSDARLVDLFDQLVRVEILLWNAVERRLRAEHELPVPWFEMMRVADRLGGARVRDVAEALTITEGGASKIVDRVQAAGYAERTRDPADGRSSRITLTPRGIRMLRAATATAEAELAERVGAVLGPDSLDRLDATLRLLRAANTAAAAENYQE
ncbi:putative MarR family transcriptional regulator [Nocardia brasiliensis NBRC 14402]|uniref:MarR family winged helix-turn-helix transcriptional regulator n=1 Tax=Nocardia brasiliensis TaxID=37326 RepID=UPI0002F94A13|nr:MarR family winged helix-turn-helix transcriptional regulator [Nocardia brasiliensis]ASF09694.1 MarR family transcriptional regulator [Nocardia brasiliensis]GAJ85020.1 putative MarR family transcriptional regulator [Nocardia brasiliensis NBRC 14402]SUB55267.1 homoprotocatechuate degradation operon regulator, HpaR [Nocardia brasiliensis]